MEITDKMIDLILEDEELTAKLKEKIREAIDSVNTKTITREVEDLLNDIVYSSVEDFKIQEVIQDRVGKFIQDHFHITMK